MRALTLSVIFAAATITGASALEHPTLSDVTATQRDNALRVAQSKPASIDKDRMKESGVPKDKMKESGVPKDKMKNSGVPKDKMKNTGIEKDKMKKQ